MLPLSALLTFIPLFHSIGALIGDSCIRISRTFSEMGVTSLTPTLYTSSLRSSFSLSPPEPSNCRFNSSFLYCNRNVLKSSQWRSKRKFVRISGSSSTLKDYINDDATRESNTDIWADSECVEVIAIGNRVDPVLDFCLRSPAHSQSLRFWYAPRNSHLFTYPFFFFAHFWRRA